MWLKNLSNKLDHSEIDRLLTESARQDKKTQIAAYMYAIVNANSIIMEEAMKVKQKRKTFHQIVEEAGFAAEWEARGEARSEARAQQERENWQTVVATKDAEIARLRAKLEEIKR